MFDFFLFFNKRNLKLTADSQTTKQVPVSITRFTHHMHRVLENRLSDDRFHLNS